MKKLAIIGGGAAGLTAAITAARELHALGWRSDKSVGSKTAEVVIYERDERVGRSILATGNGRCNFSNASIVPNNYNHSGFVTDVYFALHRQMVKAAHHINLYKPSRLSDPVHDFFADLGLLWREESQGRLYPFANKASVVLDILRDEARALGVREVCKKEVIGIEAPRQPGGPFHIRLIDGAIEHAEAVMLASGGKLPEHLPTGVQVVPLSPKLGALRTQTHYVRQLDNLRVEAEVSLYRAGKVVACERGEILFRRYGVSGIAVFNLSRFAEPGDQLAIDFLPGWEKPDATSFLFSRRKRLRLRGRVASAEEVLSGFLLPAVAHCVIGYSGVEAKGMLAKGQVPLLAEALKSFLLEVQGINDARQCQVMRGGLDLKDFDPATLSSRSVSGLYAAGEVLDIDGPCGGYNLHWAWQSGMVAGCHAAQYLS